MRARKRWVLLMVAGVLVGLLFYWTITAYQKKLDGMENNGYGIAFEKICDVAFINDWQAELRYDQSTGIIYVVYAKSMTPYMMLDSFGCMTVGVYDEKTGMIHPAEFEGEEITVDMRGGL